MKKKTYICTIIVCGCAMLLSASMIAKYYIMDAKYTGEFEKLTETVQNVRSGNEVNSTAEQITLSNGKTVLPDYTALYLQNSDTAGWLKIEGTTINYPVMQTPQDPNYYLRRSFEKQYSDYGVPYVAEGCDIFLPDDNLIIHGHHIKNGKMFGALADYKDDGFYREHSIVSLDTLADNGEYVIFAIFETEVGTKNDFAYYNFINAGSKDEFDSYVSKCKELALFETGVSAEYGDKLLTLSTCDYFTENGRLVVVAKKISG